VHENSEGPYSKDNVTRPKELQGYSAHGGGAGTGMVLVLKKVCSKPGGFTLCFRND
jgi:hypothetical protein